MQKLAVLQVQILKNVDKVPRIVEIRLAHEESKVDDQDLMACREEHAESFHGGDGGAGAYEDLSTHRTRVPNCTLKTVRRCKKPSCVAGM